MGTPGRYLRDYEWDEFDAILAAAGFRPSEFSQEFMTTRQGFFGPKRLPLNDQWAGYRHNRYGDIFIQMRQLHGADGQDGEDDESDEEEFPFWLITASPPVSDRRYDDQERVDTLDDVKSYFGEWAATAAREVAARRRRERNVEEAATSEPIFPDLHSQPLALPQVAGFVDDELKPLLEKGLADEGLSKRDADARLSGILADARMTLEDWVRSVPREQIPERLARYFTITLADQVAGEPLVGLVARITMAATKYFCGMG